MVLMAADGERGGQPRINCKDFLIHYSLQCTGPQTDTMNIRFSTAPKAFPSPTPNARNAGASLPAWGRPNLGHLSSNWSYQRNQGMSWVCVPKFRSVLEHSDFLKKWNRHNFFRILLLWRSPQMSHNFIPRLFNILYHKFMTSEKIENIMQQILIMSEIHIIEIVFQQPNAWDIDQHRVSSKQQSECRTTGWSFSCKIFWYCHSLCVLGNPWLFILLFWSQCEEVAVLEALDRLTRRRNRWYKKGSLDWQLPGMVPQCLFICDPSMPPS